MSRRVYGFPLSRISAWPLFALPFIITFKICLQTSEPSREPDQRIDSYSLRGFSNSLMESGSNDNNPNPIRWLVCSAARCGETFSSGPRDVTENAGSILFESRSSDFRLGFELSNKNRRNLIRGRPRRFQNTKWHSILFNCLRWHLNKRNK